MFYVCQRLNLQNLKYNDWIEWQPNYLCQMYFQIIFDDKYLETDGFQGVWDYILGMIIVCDIHLHYSHVTTQ